LIVAAATMAGELSLLAALAATATINNYQGINRVPPFQKPDGSFCVPVCFVIKYE
jgi:hydroxymethylglutaryl-CoA reductase